MSDIVIPKTVDEDMNELSRLIRMEVIEEEFKTALTLLNDLLQSARDVYSAYREGGSSNLPEYQLQNDGYERYFKSNTKVQAFLNKHNVCKCGKIGKPRENNGLFSGIYCDECWGKNDN